MFMEGRIPGALALAASLSLIILAPAQASSVVAHASSNQVTPAALARFNAKITALTQAHEFSGSVLVAQGDKVLLRKGYGLADQSRQMHNTSSTEFVNDGLAVEFAAVGILQLEDAGKLHDQDHLCTYLPHCPVSWSAITIHELLSATAGIHDLVNQPTLGENIGQSYTIAQVAGFAMREPLEHKPGSGLDSRANGLRVVETYLVELLSGESFGRYVQDHFLRPLGLLHTGYYLHTPRLAQHAGGYQSWQEPATDYPEQYDMSLFGGSAYSTVDDAFRWERALDTGRILSAASTAKLLTASYTSCHTPTGCGSGLTSGGTTEGRAIVTWHSHPITYLSGTLPDIGFEDATNYFTDAGVTVIFLANQSGSMQSVSGTDRLLFS